MMGLHKLILSVILLPNLLCAMTTEEFSTWWANYRSYSKVPIELQAMEDYFVDQGLTTYSSNYWNFLNKKNIEQISDYGYKNFKQTVTQNYFTWVVSMDHPYASNLKSLVKKRTVKLSKKELKKTHSLFTKEQSFQFNTITEYLLNYILQIGGAPLLEKLEEPLIGNPPSVMYKGKRVSQDIFNSLLEYMSVSAHCSLDKMSTVIEVGAGSGRTAFCFMTLLPNIKYVIVDVPPALYVSQKYLSEVFPSKKVMTFRPFRTFEEVAKEFAASDVVFLTPDQLKKLPDRSCDLFLAIDCLHEMQPRSISYYLSEADRLSNYLYFKCWERTVVPYDDISYTSKSYPINNQWSVLFNSPCSIPSGFFHAMYLLH